MTEGHCKPNMKVNDRNIVTASGDSDPQMPAGRSEQAGSCRSSSNDCRDTGVASQAPVILSATSAEPNSTDDLEPTSQTSCGMNVVNAATKLTKSVKCLKTCLITQDSDLKQLFAKASALETFAEKSRSPQIKAAIEEVLAVVEDIRDKRNPVARACNAVMFNSSTVEAELRRPPVACSPSAGTTMIKQINVSTQTSIGKEYFMRPKKSNACTQTTSTTIPDPGIRSVSTKERATDTPCWWEAGPMRPQPKGQFPSKKTAEKIEEKETVDNASEPEFQVVKRRKRRNKRGANNDQKEQNAKGDTATVRSVKVTKVKRRRPPKTQAVVIDKPTGTMTYAEMVKEIKATVGNESLSFEITTRRAKSGNLILQTSEKDNADKLASVLTSKFGDSTRVRRPSPSIALLLIGIEDSVDADELARVLKDRDSELIASNKLNIREGLNGVRTAIARVPLAPGLRLARAKRFKVGWAFCRVKELANNPGCARCTEPGHVAADCTGRDMRKCFRCKRVGHLIIDCNFPQPRQTLEATNGNRSTGEQCDGTPDQV